MRRDSALKRLHEIGVATEGRLDAPKLGRLVVDSARDLLQADSAGLYWHDEFGDLRRIGENDAAYSGVEAVPPVGTSVARFAFQDNQVIVAENYASCAKAYSSALARGLKSIAAVPLRVNEQAAGVLVVRGYTPRTFEREQIELLQLLAAQVSPVLHGDRLWAELERRRTTAEALTADLGRGLACQEMQLYYQPKIDCITGQCTRVEALVRWLHPARGLLRPDEFIPIAEESGLIQQLTKGVLHIAARQAWEWQNVGLDVSVAVNVSVQDLRDVTFARLVGDLILRWSLAQNRLRLEVTESTIMAQVPDSVIRDLTALGVPLSIDDFGTGYSSLTRIKELPVDEIKIDRSFITGVASMANDDIIVRSIIDLAHNLGDSVVAEGVETPEVWDWLLDAGCDAGQGYYLGQPMPAQQLTHWLQSRK